MLVYALEVEVKVVAEVVLEERDEMVEKHVRSRSSNNWPNPR